MSILVTSTPGTGHIHPMIPLVRELAGRGHDLLWATGPSSCATIESLGITTASAGLDLADRNALFAPRLAELAHIAPRDRRPYVMPIIMGEISTPPMAIDLRPLFDRFRPELVVHEVAELAAAPLARARDIPHATVAFSDVVAPDVMQAVAAAVAPIWIEERLSPAPDAGWFEHLYLHPFPPVMTAPSSPDGDDRDDRDDRARPMRPMRPMAVGADAVEPPAWLGSFASARPGVYVTFGTEVGLMAPWSSVLEALASFDVDVVVTVGHPDLAGVIGAVPPNVRLETWVPQHVLLERASLVISHAGAGTTLAAAAAGLAQLCIPIAADQWQNADAIARAGAGFVAELAGRTPELLAAQVADLLAGACLAGTERVAAEIAAMPAPAEIAPLIEVLARS